MMTMPLNNNPKILQDIVGSEVLYNRDRQAVLVDLDSDPM